MYKMGVAVNGRAVVDVCVLNNLKYLLMVP